MLNRPLLTLFFLAFGAILDCLHARQPAANHPNIVFILVDDMGFGDAGCFNPHSKIRTPNIDSLAAEGIRFTDAHAPGPLCHMSRYGLMTGRLPFRTNVSLWPKQPLITVSQLTLPAMLNRNGYHTAMVGKWHLGFEENGYVNRLPGGPVDRGFDSFFGIRASTDIPPYFYIRGAHAVAPPTQSIAANNSKDWSPIQGKFWRGGQIAPEMALEDVLPKLTEEAVQVIEDHARLNQPAESTQPLMLYLAYPAPHTPWLPSAEFAGKSLAGMYGDFVEMTDAMIGRVLDTLDQQQMSENTIVIFSSDNGPTWYEQDVAKFDHDSSGGFRGMKADAWEAGHRVPLIIRWPNNVPAGTQSSQLICFTDFLATLAALVGDPLEEVTSGKQRLDSVNLLPAILKPQITNSDFRKSLVIQSGSGLMTVRSDNWKLINGLGSGGFSKPSKRKPAEGEPPGQLYDLAKDPQEQHNVYAQHPDIVEELTELLRTELKKH